MGLDGCVCGVSSMIFAAILIRSIELHGGWRAQGLLWDVPILASAMRSGSCSRSVYYIVYVGKKLFLRACHFVAQSVHPRIIAQRFNSFNTSRFGAVSVPGHIITSHRHTSVSRCFPFALLGRGVGNQSPT